MSKIGLQMYTVRNNMGSMEELDATLGKIEEIGISSVQISIPAYTTAEGLQKLLTAHSMTADATHLATNTVHTVEQERQALDRIKRECEIFGCDVVSIGSIPEEFRASADGYRKYAEILNYEGRLMRENGLRYIYHFHAFEFVNFGDIRGIDILLNETDPDAVYFQPDVFWLTNAGCEPSSALKMFKGRAFWIHVKDYAIKQLEGIIESVPYCFAVVGEGNLNWDGIMKTASEMGIEKYVIEQDQCDRDVFDCIASSVKNLNAMGIR